MDAFFEEVNAVQDAIQEVKDNVTRIEALHSRQLQSSGADDQGAAQLTAELDEHVDGTSRLIKAIKGKLKAIDIANERVPAGSGDLQMRRSQAAALRRKFLEVAQQYQKVEQVHRQRVRERMERQFRIVNPNATQEEVDAMLDGDGNVFAQEVLGTGRRGEARRALQEVQDRHEDVKKIERTILELSQLFQEMATMVEQQGDVLDSIEKSVDNAAQYTEEAVVHLDQAIVHRLSARKKLWILTAVVAVLLLIAAIMIYMYIIKPAMMLVPSGGSSSAASSTAAAASTTAAAATATAGS